MTNLKAWLANGDDPKTPRARRIRELAAEAEQSRAHGNAASARSLEELANLLLDHDMALRRGLQAALFTLSAAIWRARVAKPADCDCASPAEAYAAHPELRPLLDDVKRLQRQVDELFHRVHRDDEGGSD